MAFRSRATLLSTLPIDAGDTPSYPAGTRFVDNGEEAEAEHFNRAFGALAENTDDLNTRMTRDIASPEVGALVGFTGSSIIIDPSGGAAGNINYTGTLYCGESGWTGQERLDQIFQLLDEDYNEVLVAGSEVKITSITGNSLGDGFVATATTLNLSATIPSANYRIGYFVGTNVGELPAYALSLAGLRGLEELPGEDRPADRVTYAGGPAWHDGTTNPATEVESQLDKIVTDLVADAGADRIGASAITSPDGLVSVAVGSAQDQIQELLGKIAADRREATVARATTGRVSDPGMTAGAIEDIAAREGFSALVAVMGSTPDIAAGVLSSTSWTVTSHAASANALYGVAWCPSISKYVAVGIGAGAAGVAILTDADGLGTWTLETTPLTTGNKYLNKVVDDTNSGYIVTVGNDSDTTSGIVLRSADGSTWVTPTTGPSANFLRSVAVNPAGVMIAVGASTTPRSAIFRSTDGGDTWVLEHEDVTFASWYDTVVYDPVNAVWIVGGQAVGIVRSTDATGTLWVVESPGGIGHDLVAAATDGRGFVLGRNGAQYKWTFDGGVSWKGDVGGQSFVNIFYANGRFFMVTGSASRELLITPTVLGEVTFP